MKANGAPEKIYLNPLLMENGESVVRRRTFERQRDSQIEYIRTDAFIEKACAWLKSHYRDYMYNPTGERLEAFFGGDMCNDFEDYMKESKV